MRRGLQFVVLHMTILFVEKIIFSHWNDFSLWWKATDLYIHWVYFRAWSSTPVSCVFSYQNYTILITVVLYQFLKSGSPSTLTVFFVRIVLATCVPLQFHIISEPARQILQISMLRFDPDCFEFVNHFVKNCHLNDTESSDSRAW